LDAVLERNHDVAVEQLLGRVDHEAVVLPRRRGAAGRDAGLQTVTDVPSARHRQRLEARGRREIEAIVGLALRAEIAGEGDDALILSELVRVQVVQPAELLPADTTEP